MDHSADISSLRTQVDRHLSDLVVGEEPGRLYDAVRYALEGKGKRLRPILTLLASDLFGYSREEAMPVALSMEVFHTFTLVHDDIMDQSELRRGRETVHVRWDEATAVLCGDYLSGLSTRLLSLKNHPRLQEILKLHFDTVQALCEGQVMDMMFEEEIDVSVERYLSMIDRKTASLLSCCLQMGGLLGNATESHLEALKDIGWHMGRAFQIQDDLLDLTATTAKWGKAVGGDLMAGKKTYLSLMALETAQADDRDYILNILSHARISESNIPEIRQKMRDLGVLEAAETTVIFHSDQALESTMLLPQGESRDTLQYLIRDLQRRLH